MPRTLFRTLLTTATSLLLLALSAVPAMAASAGTKPDADDEWLIGSMSQLSTALAVGVVIAIIAWVMLPSKDTAAEDEHH